MPMMSLDWFKAAGGGGNFPDDMAGKCEKMVSSGVWRGVARHTNSLEKLDTS